MTSDNTTPKNLQNTFGQGMNSPIDDNIHPHNDALIADIHRILGASPLAAEILDKLNKKNILSYCKISKNYLSRAESDTRMVLFAPPILKKANNQLIITALRGYCELHETHFGVEMPTTSLTRSDFEAQLTRREKNILMRFTKTAYELAHCGQLTDFLDSLAAMGYAKLIDAYVIDLKE